MSVLSVKVNLPHDDIHRCSGRVVAGFLLGYIRAQYIHGLDCGCCHVP